MKKTITVLIILVVLILAVYFILNSLGSNSTSMSSPATNTQSQVTTEVQAPVSNTPITASVISVDIKNFAFSPSVLNIKVGTMVTWTNDDSVGHTVTANNGLFDSKTLMPGRSFSYTFTNAGTISYHCSIHPMMTATITVQ